MNFPPELETWLKASLPEGTLPVAVVASVYYIGEDSTTPLTATLLHIDNIGAVAAIGMVELAKFDLMGKFQCGPHDPWWRDHDHLPDDDDQPPEED